MLLEDFGRDLSCWAAGSCRRLDGSSQLSLMSLPRRLWDQSSGFEGLDPDFNRRLPRPQEDLPGGISRRNSDSH